jgi:hypothetical protein
MKDCAGRHGNSASARFALSERVLPLPCMAIAASWTDESFAPPQTLKISQAFPFSGKAFVMLTIGSWVIFLRYLSFRILPQHRL